MSKLTEAMDLLKPLMEAENWDGNAYLGPDSPRSVLEAVWDDMRQVDVMMEHIAEATSRPADAGERVRAAIGMAAAELPHVPASDLPALAMEALQALENAASTSTSTDSYRALLLAAQSEIAARLAAARTP